jgi:(1->4)-alpha-D-glucan 1-alpha-D-glucosylmutase
LAAQSEDLERTAAALLDSRRDGRVKLFVMMRALATRSALRETFEQGAYVPLEALGVRRGSVFAFARRHRGTIALTCVPRLVAELRPDAAAPPIGRAAWGDAKIALPTGVAGVFRDTFTGATMKVGGGETSIDVATALDKFPVALLIGHATGSDGTRA